MSALPKFRQPDADLPAQVAELTQAVRILSAELMKRGDDSARMLKPSELAELWGYTGPNKIYELIRSGVIPAVKLEAQEGDGKHTYRIPLVWVRAYVMKQLEDDPAAAQVLRLLAGEE